MTREHIALWTGTALALAFIAYVVLSALPFWPFLGCFFTFGKVC